MNKDTASRAGVSHGSTGGGLNVAYQFRASDFLTGRHMDQQQNQAAISRIHHDVRSPE